MLIRLSVPDGQPLPPNGTAVPFMIDGRAGLATLVSSHVVAGYRRVASVVVPEWVVDCFGHDGVTVREPVALNRSGRGPSKGHQQRTAHGAYAPYALASVT